MKSFINFVKQKDEKSVIIVFALILIFSIYKSFYMIYPDLTFTYPFKSFDSYQWIADALLYAGYDVDISYRNPGLPVVIAILIKIGVLNLLPILTVILHVVFFVYLAFFLRKYFNPLIVAVTILFFYFNFSIQTFFDYILADQWAVTCQLIAIYHLAQVKENNLHLMPFMIFASISFLFQFAIGFLIFAFLIYFFTDCWGSLKKNNRFYVIISATIGLAVLIISPNFIFRWIEFGSPFFSSVNPFQLVKFHLFGIPYYVINYFAFFGLPVAIISILGFIISLKQKGTWILINIGVLSYFIFWVLFYSWLDVRFLLYFIPFLPFYFANGLKKLHLTSLIRVHNSIIKNFVMVLLIVFFLLYGLFDKNSPFERSQLPITPFTILTFPTKSITNWDGNLTINLSGLSLNYKSNIFSFLKYYRRNYKNIMNSGKNVERLSLQDIHETAKKKYGLKYKIQECGFEKSDYFSSMKRKILFRRDPIPCGVDGQVRLLVNANQVEDYSFYPFDDNRYHQGQIILNDQKTIHFNMRKKYLENKISLEFNPVAISGDLAKVTISFLFYDKQEKHLSTLTYVLHGKKDYWNYENQIHSGISYITYIKNNSVIGQNNLIAFDNILRDQNIGAQKINATPLDKDGIHSVKIGLHSWYNKEGLIKVYVYGLKEYLIAGNL